MASRRRWRISAAIIAGVVFLDTVLVAIVTNLATGILPEDKVDPYEPWIWTALIGLTVLGVVLAVVTVVVGSGKPDDIAVPPETRLINNLPHRNPRFTGRTAVLDRLRAALADGGRAAVVSGPTQAQALYGRAGVGKTEVALEYAHTSGYRIAWWIKAGVPSEIPGQLAVLHHTMGLADPPDRDFVTSVKVELNSRRDWLLVFDNAQRAEDVEPFRPGSPHGHVLVTTRLLRGWEQVGATVSIEPFEPDEARAFLLRVLGTVDDEADALARDVDYLPLFLAQAAGTIRTCGWSIARYRQEFAADSKAMLDRDQPVDYPYSGLRAYSLALQQVEDQSEVARRLLDFYAFLAPEDIPQSLVSHGGRALPQPLRGLDELGVATAVGLLCDFSLVSRDNGVVRVHRTVQQITRDLMSKTTQNVWRRAAVKTLQNAMDVPGTNQLVLDTHVRAVAGHQEAKG